MNKKIKGIASSIALLSLTLISGCSVNESVSTNYPNDACKMLLENKDWFHSSNNAYKKWGVPISVQLSVIKHESSFNHDASTKTSSAYGYSQALKGTFSDYKKETKNKKAKRNSFADSTDFIGWYFDKTYKAIKHSPHNASTFYLAYHDGIGGFKKKTYLKKKWLMDKSKEVQAVSNKYRAQLNKCRLPK